MKQCTHTLGQLIGMVLGWRWEGCSGWGTHVHPWLIHVIVWQKSPQYCKAIILQLRILKIKRTIFSILFASQTKTCLTLPFSAGYCKVLFFNGANSPALYYLFSIATCSNSQMNQTSLCRKCHMVLHLSPRETSENPVKARDYLREPGNILL